MKINSTVILTFFLLLMMVGAGSVSAWFSFNMGSQSLEGVTEPDSNPTKKLTRKQGEKQESQLVFVKEKDIIVQNYDYIKGKKNNNSSEKNPPKPQEKKPKTAPKPTENQKTESEKESFINSPPENKPLLPAPVQSKDQDITLEVSNIQLQDGAILLNVSLKNDGRKAVRFLYSFLDVRDDKSSLLSAITDGLPGELPANGEAYNGTIRIPSALLSEAKTISLSLTDYPDQKLQLKLDNLPVTFPEVTTEETPPEEATPETETEKPTD